MKLQIRLAYIMAELLPECFLWVNLEEDPSSPNLIASAPF